MSTTQVSATARIILRLEKARQSAASQGTQKQRDRSNAVFVRVRRTLEFLVITLADHERAVATHLDLFKRLEAIEQSWGLGQHRLTPQESEMVEEVRWSNTVVQLRIETFYFSGQKALDDIAQLIEEQLGRSKTKVEAHSHLAHRLPEKAAELGLAAPPHDLLKQIDGLSVSIKRFRNKYVAHTGDPSLTRGMHLRPNGTTTMTAGEAGVESEPPKRLMAQLNAYVEAVLDYIGVAPV